MVASKLRAREAWDAKVVVVADIAVDPHLKRGFVSLGALVKNGDWGRGLTVAVMSAEHTSHTYLTPPSVPLMAVFFLITPILAVWMEELWRRSVGGRQRCGAGVEAVAVWEGETAGQQAKRHGSRSLCEEL